MSKNNWFEENMASKIIIEDLIKCGENRIHFMNSIGEIEMDGIKFKKLSIEDKIDFLSTIVEDYTEILILELNSN